MSRRIRNLTDLHHRAIHLLVLHGWSAGRGRGSTRVISRVSDFIGVQPDTLKHWRLCPRFRQEYDKQLALHHRQYAEITLADKRERVRVLNDVFNLVGSEDPELQLAILRAIREEVGDQAPVRADTDYQSNEARGPILKDLTYEQWLALNREGG